MAGSGNVELANYFNIMTEVKKKQFIYLFTFISASTKLNSVILSLLLFLYFPDFVYAYFKL